MWPSIVRIRPSRQRRRKTGGVKPPLHEELTTGHQDARSGARSEEAEGAPAPEDQEEDADEYEGEAKTDPETESAPVTAEAEVSAEGETHKPVGGEVTEHGSARIASAAECAGSNGLDAIEELESGTSDKESGGAMDDGFVESVDAGDEERENEESNAHGGHEGGADKDGSVAGVARVGGGAAAEGLADSDRGGGGESEWNHVGEGNGVESDLMTGLSDGAETRDQGGDDGKDGNLSGLLKRGGKAESDELADAGEVGLNRRFEEFGFVAHVVPEKVDDEDESEIAAGDAGGDAGTGNPVGVETEFAVDEDVIADEVDEIGGDERESNGTHHVHTLEGAANSEVEKERDETGG